MISPFKSYGRSCGISRKSSSFPLVTIDAPFIPVVPHKAVAEVSKIGNL